MYYFFLIIQTQKPFIDKKSRLYLWMKVKRIDNFQIKIAHRFGAKTQLEKCVESLLQKQQWT